MALQFTAANLQLAYGNVGVTTGKGTSYSLMTWACLTRLDQHSVIMSLCTGFNAPGFTPAARLFFDKDAGKIGFGVKCYNAMTYVWSEAVAWSDPAILTIQANTWYHVVGVHRTVTHALYINGVKHAEIGTPSDQEITASVGHLAHSEALNGAPP